MSVFPILCYPDDRLRTIASPVTKFDRDLVYFVDNLSATMYAEKGVGLAATQVNYHVRVIVVDVSENRDELMVFVNPEIIKIGEKCSLTEEGCLSVPAQLVRVSRPENIIVQAFDQYGKPFEISATGLLSVCIQHEVDHLNGKLIFDHLSQIKQQLYKEKREKINKKKKRNKKQ